MSVQIGSADFSGNKNFSGGVKWFYVDDTKDNIYRIIPPIKSMANSGRVAKYYKVHRGVRGTDGKQKPFLCVEEKNKDGVIVKHCPFCDRVRELESRLEELRLGGASDEQLKKFRYQYIFPLQVEKKYYINVINQENQLGVLAIGQKMFNDLESKGKEWQQKGINLAGLNGVFLNFKINKKFKGDKDAIHTANVHMVPQQDGSFRYIPHTLTPDIIERLDKEAADLGTLFKGISTEEMAMLLNLEGEERARLMDTLFAAPEKEESSLNVRIPGTSASATLTPKETANGLELQGVDVAAPMMAHQVQQRQAVQEAYANPLSGSAPQGAAAQAIKPAAVMSDEDFLAFTRPKK
jgi:hypothetical protein